MEGDLDSMWNEATQDISNIDPDTENWKIQTLPLARVKKIMKSEEIILQELEKEKQQKQDGGGGSSSDGQEKSNVKFMISGEAPVLMSKACELLIKDLSFRAWRHTERNRRRTLQRQDLHAAVGESEVYDFLIDIVPRVTTALPTTTPSTARAAMTMHGAAPGVEPPGVMGAAHPAAGIHQGLPPMGAPLPHAPGIVGPPTASTIPTASATPSPAVVAGTPGIPDVSGAGVPVLNFQPPTEMAGIDARGIAQYQDQYFMAFQQMQATPADGSADATAAATAAAAAVQAAQAASPHTGQPHTMQAITHHQHIPTQQQHQQQPQQQHQPQQQWGDPTNNAIGGVGSAPPPGP